MLIYSVVFKKMMSCFLGELNDNSKDELKRWFFKLFRTAILNENPGNLPHYCPFYQIWLIDQAIIKIINLQFQLLT